MKLSRAELLKQITDMLDNVSDENLQEVFWFLKVDLIE